MTELSPFAADVVVFAAFIVLGMPVIRLSGYRAPGLLGLWGR